MALNMNGWKNCCSHSMRGTLANSKLSRHFSLKRYTIPPVWCKYDDIESLSLITGYSTRELPLPPSEDLSHGSYWICVQTPCQWSHYEFPNDRWRNPVTRQWGRTFGDESTKVNLFFIPIFSSLVSFFINFHPLRPHTLGSVRNVRAHRQFPTLPTFFAREKSDLYFSFFQSASSSLQALLTKSNKTRSSRGYNRGFCHGSKSGVWLSV